MSRPSLAAVTVLADHDDVSLTITEPLPLDFLDIRHKDGDFIAIRKLSAENARQVADCVEGALTAGRGTRLTLNGRTTAIVANGTSLTFVQSARRRVVTHALGHEIVRQLRSAANALDVATSADGGTAR